MFKKLVFIINTSFFVINKKYAVSFVDLRCINKNRDDEKYKMGNNRVGKYSSKIC